MVAETATRELQVDRSVHRQPLIAPCRVRFDDAIATAKIKWASARQSTVFFGALHLALVDGAGEVTLAESRHGKLDCPRHHPLADLARLAHVSEFLLAL